MGNFSFFLSVIVFFFLFFFCSKLTLSKNSFRNTISISKSLDPDQAQHFVGPDLVPLNETYKFSYYHSHLHLHFHFDFLHLSLYFHRQAESAFPRNVR